MYAHGKADFIAKLQIALKECSESEYWLELLIENGYYEDSAILKQCTEVKRLLIVSINTAKKKPVYKYLLCCDVSARRKLRLLAAHFL
ncbi:four helix bundle protein [Fournierella massiliensis]|uniref:four helix bundle protein n=1 Tax=Allofournierella massiliensis TaxID=1650663 RepID=UPI00352157A2